MGIRYKKDGAYHYDGGNPPVEPTQPVDQEYQQHDWKDATPLDIRVADNIEDWKADNPQALVDTGYPFPKMAKEVPMSKEMTERLWELMAENTELSQQLYMAKHRLEQIKRLLEE
tara:strand:- start:79 stop:423 length:345 start_codon:yes stop_codon:yes gene_type:complete